MKALGPAETASRFAIGFQIVFGRPGAMDALTPGHAEFKESFWGAALLFPVVLYLFMRTPLPPELDGVGDLPQVLSHTLYYVTAWIYWPLIMAYVSDMLGKGESWLRFVIALNWSAAAILLLQVIALLLTRPGAEGGIGDGIVFGLLLWGLIVHARLLRHFFATGTAATIGLVLGEFMIGEMLRQVRAIVIYSAG